MIGINFEQIPLQHPSSAFANVRGNASHADLMGMVRFYQTEQGVLVVAKVTGLPQAQGDCAANIFGFHIHEGSSCTDPDSFADTGAHFNPKRCGHPAHAGDLPPLFGNAGSAFMSFVSDRFTVDDIINRTVVIHGMHDDFQTDPSGMTGERIACGVIVRNQNRREQQAY